MGDGAVLAGGVHALKDDQHGMLLAGVKHLLEPGKSFAVLLEERVRLAVVLQTTFGGGVHIVEANFCMWLDEPGRFELHVSPEAVEQRVSPLRRGLFKEMNFPMRSRI